jgi:hypothetical protein
MLGFIAIIIALVALFLIFKYHKIHSFINFAIAGFIIFIVLSFAYVYFTRPSDMGTFNGLVLFLKTYLSWLVSIVSTTGKTVGYVVSQNWSAATNSTIVP